MTEFEAKILKRLADLESEIKRLKSEKSSSESDRANDFERLPGSATVGKEYVAYRFKCTLEAVRRGRAGTHKLKPFLKTAKPMRWIKSDVDTVWGEHTKTKTEKALDAIGNSRQVNRRRKSIITKPQKIAA